MNYDSFAYPPRLLSKDEAARYIGVSPPQLGRLVADGIMPDRDGGGLQSFLEKHRKTGGPAKTQEDLVAERTAQSLAERRPGQRKYWRDAD